MFRAVFEEGARIGAGPVLRLWRRLLLVRLQVVAARVALPVQREVPARVVAAVHLLRGRRATCPGSASRRASPKASCPYPACGTLCGDDGTAWQRRRPRRRRAAAAAARRPLGHRIGRRPLAAARAAAARAGADPPASWTGCVAERHRPVPGRLPPHGTRWPRSRERTPTCRRTPHRRHAWRSPGGCMLDPRPRRRLLRDAAGRSGDIQVMLDARPGRRATRSPVGRRRRPRRPRRRHRRGRSPADTGELSRAARRMAHDGEVPAPAAGQAPGPARPGGTGPAALCRPHHQPDARGMLRPAQQRRAGAARVPRLDAASSRSRRRCCSGCTAARTRGRSSPTSTPTTCGSTCGSRPELFLKRLLVGGVEQDLRAQPQLPQRGRRRHAQPRVHDAGGVRGLRRLRHDARC